MTNPDQVKQFGQKLLNIYTGGLLTKMIAIGYQTGLFEASRQGTATSEALSERAGLHERYVREWLGAMTTSGIYQISTMPAPSSILFRQSTQPC